MRKTAFLFILLILFCFCLPADDLQVVSSTSRMISAFKTSWTGSLPNQTVELRILDYNTNEINSGEDITMSINTRNQAFEAFSWVLGGNIYKAVTLTFTFGPMYWEADTGATEIIPYSVKLEKVSSRIGNTAIPIGQTSNSVSPFTNEFSPYSFYYADSITGEGTTDVNTGSVIKTLTYNMSTYTVVKNSGGSTVTYTESVCNYWNRTGKATVTLKITSEGYKVNTTTSYAAGTYFAAIRVEVSTQ